MIFDAREIPSGTVLKTDVAIVGAGAASIALACELQNQNLDVVLLESGGLRIDTDTQDLARSEVDDPIHYGPPHLFCQRCFGGHTSLWNGGCAPYDDIDFQVRPHVPFSG